MVSSFFGVWLVMVCFGVVGRFVFVLVDNKEVIIPGEERTRSVMLRKGGGEFIMKNRKEDIKKYGRKIKENH